MAGFDPVTAIVNLIHKGLDKFVADKGESNRLKAELTKFTLEQTHAKEGAFRDFILQYEGAAKDIPRIVVVFRSLIRPCFTILIGYLDFLYFTTPATTWSVESVALLKAINIIKP